MVENIIRNTPFRRESHLSKTKDIVTEARPGLTNDMQFGYIMSIDHQANTCSVQLDNDHNNVIGSTNIIPNVPLPVNGYGVNKEGNYYGDYPNVAQGARVLLGYIGGDTKQPVVIGIYPPQEFIPHLTPTKESIVDDTELFANDLWSYKKVFPSQQVQLDQGNGDSTRTFNGHSFIGAMTTESTASENQYDVNYTGIQNQTGDLTKDYYLKAFQDYSNRKEYDLNDLAQDFVLINQSTSAMDNHLTKLMVKSTGELQEIFNNKVIDNKLLRVDASLFDGYRITNQLDSKGIDPKQYLKFELNDNHIQFYAQDGNDSSKLELTSKGVYLDGELILSEHSITQLQDELNLIEKEITPLLDDISNVGGIKGIMSKISNNTSGINTVSGRVNTLEISVNPVLNEIAENGGINGIVSKISNNTSSINNVSGRVSALESTVNSLSGDISNVGGIKALMTKISANTESINALSGRVTTLESYVPNIKDNTAWISKFTSGNTSNETLTDIDNSINNLSNQLKDSDTKISQNTAKINKNMSDIAQNSININNNKSDISSNKSDISKNTSDIAKNVSEIKSIGDIAGNNSSEITKTNTKLDNLIQTLKDKGVI